MSNNVKRWRVVDWPDKPVDLRTLCPVCPHCGWEGELQIGPTPGGLIIATIGLSIVFEPAEYEPPANSLPESIQCRGCRRIWASYKEQSDVR